MFFTSVKVHFVIEATLHHKGICISASDAYGMSFNAHI